MLVWRERVSRWFGCLRFKPTDLALPMHRYNQLHTLKVLTRLALVAMFAKSSPQARRGQVQKDGLRTLQSYFPIQNHLEQSDCWHRWSRAAATEFHYSGVTFERGYKDILRYQHWRHKTYVKRIEPIKSNSKLKNKNRAGSWQRSKSYRWHLGISKSCIHPKNTKRRLFYKWQQFKVWNADSSAVSHLCQQVIRKQAIGFIIR